MNDKERVDKVIDFIGKHLDEALELDALCRIACFSKYHFYRLFTVYTGLPLRGYIAESLVLSIDARSEAY